MKTISQPEKLYVLVTDPRMPSKENLWGTKAARSSEEASERFREWVTGWRSNSTFAQAFRMEADRTRRIAEDDLAVELS